jgi:hypothetical protein
MKELFKKMYDKTTDEVGCKTCKNKETKIDELKYKRPGQPLSSEEMNKMAEVLNSQNNGSSCKTCGSKSMFDKKYTGLLIGGFYVVFATGYGTYKLLENLIMLFTR